MSSGSDSQGRTGGLFPPTRRTLLVSVRNGSPEALDELCTIYWQPVYAYIRYRGNGAADAEDLAQGFFYTLLRRKSLGSVDPSKGRLRTFLLTAVSRFMASEYERKMAKKRNPGEPVLPLDCSGFAEEGFVADPGTEVAPDLEFDRHWANELLKRAFQSTRDGEVREGREALFEELQGNITVDCPLDQCAAIAERLGMTPGAVKQAALRLRRRYRANLRQHVEETLVDKSEVDEEIRYLMQCFASPDSRI